MSNNIIFYKSYRHIIEMYIAFKWLLGLTLAMWIAMCCLDTFVKKNTVIMRDSFIVKPLTFEIIENKTIPIQSELNFHAERFKRKIGTEPNIAYLHFLMFIAGALVISLYNKFNEIILIITRELARFFTNANAKKLQEYSKITAAEVSKVAIIFCQKIWENLKTIAYQSKNAISAFRLNSFKKPRINLILLKKLKDIGEERRNLAQLLIAAIHENKNIRMQFQLENMAKKRLIQHIENTQKVIKENRSRYVSFQQLYLVTHQENTFLKSRMKKLTTEKEEAEKNLLELMNEVYKSKNSELKAYCSRFIVKTKDNLLNSDVGAEIQKFLQKSRSTVTTASNWQLSGRPDVEGNDSKSWLRCSSCTQITEIIKDDSLIPFVSEEPKLKGLPGECVWTVKDKDGLIKKLYEYDCESDLDTGDTIRRIREYTVYYDKDCLLDFSNSSTVVNEARSGMRNLFKSIHCPITSRKFLTGSEAFQKFMRNNINIASTSLYPVPSLD